MPKPTVSIVVPVYNVERFLGECLDSVLAQTFSDFECICVNDGSSDGSAAILASYAKRDSRIRIIDQQNAGLSAARNAGMAAARGTYVAFLDSDDCLRPDMLETTVALAESERADIVIFDYWLYFDDTGEFDTYRDQGVYARLDGRSFTLEEEPEMARFMGAWDRLYRRDYLERGGWTFPVGRLYEDMPFCVETEITPARLALTAEHLYYYRRGVQGSITSNEASERKNKEDFLWVQAYAQACMEKAGVSDAVWAAYARYFLEYALMHQRRVRPRSYFGTFFADIRAMWMKHCAQAPALKVPLTWNMYRHCLEKNHPNLFWFAIKSLNQVNKYYARLEWKIRRRKLVRAGNIDAEGARICDGTPLYRQRPW